MAVPDVGDCIRFGALYYQNTQFSTKRLQIMRQANIQEGVTHVQD